MFTSSQYFYLNSIEKISTLKKPFQSLKSLNGHINLREIIRPIFFSSSSDQSFNTLYDGEEERPNVEKKPSSYIHTGHLNSGGPCSQLYYGIGVEFF